MFLLKASFVLFRRICDGLRGGKIPLTHLFPCTRNQLRFLNASDNLIVMPGVTSLKIRLCAVTELKCTLTSGDVFCWRPGAFNCNAFDAPS